MWKPILCTLVALTAVASAQDPRIRIDEVGVRGYYSTSTPTRIKLHVDPAAAAGHRLEIRLEVGKNANYPTRSDTFTATLEPGFSGEVELPIFIYLYANSYTLTRENPDGSKPVSLEVGGAYVRADLFDANEKQVIATDRSRLSHEDTEELIVVLCNDREVCNTTQSQILFGGSEEQRNQKNHAFKFVLMNGKDSADAWWVYPAANVVVVAAPLKSLSEEQREALENYVRQGGTLILLEKEISEEAFLAAYRKGAISSDAIRVGRGEMLRIDGLSTKKLQDVFSGDNLKSVGDNVRWQMPNAGAEDLSSRIRGKAGTLFATHFVFPSLLWIIAWLVVYIAFIGFVNFAVLRRMRRREWAWVTTPLLALMFAAGIYVASEFRRPRNFSVDEIAMQLLDDRSSLAAGDTQLRIASPRVQETALITPQQALLMPPSAGQQTQPTIDIEDREEWEPGWDVNLGAQQRIDLPLLRWDFRDLNFRDFVRLPGTIDVTGPGHIKNETGRSFDNAFYVDGDARVFSLGTVAAGADIDTAKLPSKSHSEFCQCKSEGDSDKKPAAPPYTLEQVLADSLRENDKGYFVGLSREAPAWEPELEGIAPDRSRYVITLVTLSKQHD
jgi:hypothetical protein